MSGEVITVGIKTVMDISDVKANVNVLQNQFNKLKLPSGITNKFDQEISRFSATYEKYQQKMLQGIKTKGDASQASKYLNEIAREYDNIVKTYSKASGMDLKSLFKIDSGPLKDAAAEVERLTKQLQNIDINKTGFKDLGQQLSGVLKNSKFSGENGLINQMIGHFNDGEVEKAKQALQEIQKEVEKRQYATVTNKNGNTVQKPGTYSEANTTAALNLVKQLMTAADQADIKIQDIQGPLNKATQNFDNLLNKGVTSFKNIGNAAQNERAAVRGVVEENKNLVNSMASAQQQSQMLSNRIAMYFSLYEIIRKIGDVARRAFQTVKELDASMTQTAVVTNFNVSDMWEQLPTYTAAANELGSTINDVYKATTLYYQQGLNTNQAMGVATETLKMARIGGLEAAQATDMMTAALRGFNMQVNEMSAQRINDVYSKLAAITASNTEELGSAMTRTASIANSAGMQFETTSAFLAQMIETTREAPENLGTAMKTIVARFQEMKKAPSELVDSEGELLDANRVEKALKTIGVALRDTNGDFRELDQVFLEISAKWDSLSMGQQRYIATMAAGSRQQSRFIAMMSNYDRTMELVDAANNSAGASQEQFNKTLESMDTKLNKLKNAWDQFAMGLTNSTILKGAIDGLTGGITIINKFIDAIGKISPEPFKDINKSLLTLVGTLGALRLGGSLVSKHGGLLSGLLQGAAGFFQGKSFGEIGQEIGKSFNSPELIATVRAGSGEVSKSFYQGLYSNIQAEKGKIGQAISSSMQDPHYLTTINLADYLQLDNVSLADKGSAIIGALKAGLESNHDLSDTMRQKAEESLQAMEKQFSAGKSTLEHMLNSANGFAQKYNFQLDLKSIGVEQVNKSLLETGNILTTTGAKLQRFGNMLQNTPLEPFGKLLAVAGTALTSIGMTLTMIKAGIAKTTITLAADTVAWLVNTGAIEANKKALIANKAARLKNGQITEIKNAGQFLKNFAAQGGSVGTVLKGLAGKLTGVLGKLAGFAPQIIGIALAVASLHSAWKLLNWRTDQLKAAKTRAADAADQFSSIKQEVSELKDKLDELEEIDNSFKNLVTGTAEFNEKLNESNALITELISKYPMLNDSKYLFTDKNGRLILNEEGREQIQQELRQRQGNAQALSLMAAQDVKNFNSTGWLKDYDKARNKENANLARYGARYSKMARQENIAEMQARGERSSEDIFKAQKDEITANYKTAITSLFSGFKTKDFVNKDKVANIFGESYENILKQIVADTKEEDRAKAYAKAYGYDEYLGKNKFRKGNEEVEIEKDIWNDETTNKRIKANEQIINSAETVDRTLDSLNGKVANAFDDIKIESDTLISDILSSNIETNQDELKALLEKGDFEELTKNLTDEQVKALKQAGIEDLGAVLEERGKAILEAQKQQDIDLGVMIAKAQNINANDFISNTTQYANQIAAIGNQIDALNVKEKNLLTTVGQGISDSLGDQNMGRFINTFIQGTQTVRNKLTSITKDVDWTSSISALGAVTKMTKSSSVEIKKLGQEMRTSAEGSHLLSDSMQEMFAAEDFQKATENMDNFVNSSGRLDATGVQKLAQESSTLNKLLKTDAISAGGLAAALNATSISGVADVTSLNDSVLQLLSSFTQLETVMAEAHDIVSNFDPGIDTGEGVDFIKDAYEKASEYIKNGEWGNSQLESYMRLVAGDEAWTKALQKNNGNLEKTVKQLQPVLKKFENGYAQSWVNLAKGVDAYGNSIKDVKFKSKELQKLKLTEVNGGLELNVKESGATTEQVTKWIEKSYKVSSEVAKLMLADFKNMSPNLVPELEANDFYAGIKNGDFYNTNTIKTAGGNEIVALSKSTLDVLSAATGKPIAEIETAIKNSEQARNKDIQILQNTYAKGEKKGELIDNYQLLNKRLSNLSEGQKQNKDRTDTLSWLKQFTSNNTIDVTKALSYGERVGLDTSQTQGMLYEAFQALTKEGKEFEYNGQVINPSEVTSLGDFIDKLTKIDENENWNEVGAAIAEGYVNYIKGKEEQEQQQEEKEEKWESNSQSKAETYKVQPSSTKVLESRPELAAAATNEEIGDVGARAATFAKINKELNLTKAELADVNAGFIQLNMADLSTLSKDQLQQVFDMLGMTKKEAKSAKHDIDNFSALTPDQKEISIRTDISGEEKVSAILQPILDEFGDNDTTKKTLIIEAAARMAEGKNDEAEELLKQAGIEGEELETVTKQIDFTVNAGLANPKEVQDSLNKEVDKACNLGSGVSGSKKAKIKKKVQIQYEEGGKKPKTRSTITTGIKVGKDEASAKVKELEKGGSTSFTIKANDKEALKTVNAIHKKAKESETFNISANPVGSWKKDFDVVIKKHKKEEATGTHQMGSIPSLPTFESLASGKYTRQLGTGQIGPKGNGGLTLTGELGYEIAWLPREGRSMILGVNGPEMLNLPGDAVVWNHEQSKKIIKNNAIPIGSTAIGAGSAAFYPTGGSGGGAAVTTRGTTTKSENKSNSKKSKNNKYQEKIIKQTWKLLSTAGKISNWWEDISRQVEGIQRVADRNQKAFKKLIDTAGTTLSDVQKNSETYSKSLQKSIQLNEEIVKHYKDKLDALTSGKGQSAKSRRGAVSGINKAANEVTKAEAKVELAKQTKSKKDDKKAKKNLRNTKKRLKNAKKKDKSAAVDTVTYDDEIQVTTKKKTRKGKGKWKNKTVKKKKKVKSTRAVDWSKIIEYDAETDTWVLNDKEINKQAGGNKKAAKAIKEKGNKKIDEMIQRRNSAQDKIDGARESLNQLAEDVYQMFSRWEKSLTRVYLISQKLESLQKKADIYDTQEEYLSTKALAGYNPFSQESLDKLNTILTNRQNSLVEQAKAQKDLVDATYKQYEEAFQLNTYLTNGNIGSETDGESESGVNEQEAALIAFQLLKKAGAEDIDTYDSVKVQQAYDEYTKGRYINKTDEEVKKILDRIAEYQGSYYDALKESYTSVTEIYKTLNEYEEYINDFEESLLKGLEEEINKEIDKQEKLNSALTDAFKDLLDEVKRRLDQRRQAEDNAKTESDIAKKQQRLATLQADTSGGHASEIKQLQQEIAEAQQNYGRTLEDQLLERLQQQGDEAAKQRERQIKLLEIQRDLAEALGTNLEEVKEWLQNPEANKEQIKAAWLANPNQNYDEALPEQQKALENQFEEAWTKYLAYGARAQDLRDFLDEVNFDNTPQEQAAQSLQTIESDLGGLKETIEGEIKKRQAAAGEKSHNYINEVEEPTIDYGKISDFKENGIELEKARINAGNLGIDNSYASMREGGYTAEDFKKAGVSVSDALSAGFDHSQLKEGGYTVKDFSSENFGIVDVAKAGFDYKEIVNNGYDYKDVLEHADEIQSINADLITQAQEQKEAVDKLERTKQAQKKSALNAVKNIAKKIDPNSSNFTTSIRWLSAWTPYLKEFAGQSIPMKKGSGHIHSNGKLYFNDNKGNVKRYDFPSYKISSVKYDQKTWEKHAGYQQNSDTPYIKSEFKAALKKRDAKKYKQFAKGGMANFTGPAWLDGTRAKPEAVLNATETKNFIALKDILSDVMGHITDNNTTTYGDSTYEININVDHLNNDYDVDKVAKRVEKIITDNASYRNVTMVRKFR